MPQDQAGREAHIFDKTEKYFGKKVAYYCRTHNITSQWITPEQSKIKGIKTVKFPWDE